MRRLIAALFILLYFNISHGQALDPDLENSDTLSLEDRVWGLSLIWHEIKNDFAYYDKISFNWDSAYKTHLKEIHHCKNRFQYYQLLRKLVAKLGDGHTNVYLPKELREKYISNPPIRLKKVEERVFISHILNDSIKKLGLSEKDEILKVNGLDIKSYGEKYIMPYVSASTKQDLLNRTYTNELLAGAKNEKIKMAIKKRSGAIKEIEIERKLSPQRRPFDAVDFKMLPQNIGLLSINTFDDTSLTRAFSLIMPKTINCDALIIDLRRNGGGNGEYAYELLDYLFEDHYFDTQPHSRIRVSAWQSFYYPKADNWMHYPVDSLKYKVQRKPVRFLKPIAILTSEKTFSAAEDFVATIKQNKRGVIIGSPTGGSTGMNVYHSLPGGGNFRLTIKKDTFIDGSEFVGVGIKPDIEVAETVNDFMNDKDPVLDAAIRHLAKQEHHGFTLKKQPSLLFLVFHPLAFVAKATLCCKVAFATQKTQSQV